MAKKISTFEFIETAKNVHGNFYDYSSVKYVTGKSIVKITCPTHGEFRQRANNHLKGKKCPYCKNSTGERLTREAILNLYPYLNAALECQKMLFQDGHKIFADFYFIIDSQPFIVEYNGIQHYEPTSFCNMSTEEKLEMFAEQQKRDVRLRDWCSTNDVVLIEINGIEKKRLGEIEEVLRKNITLKEQRYIF